MCFYLGIDLGGTTLTASVFSQDFTLMADQSQATRTADGPQAVLRQVAALAHAVAHPFQGKRGGIAAAGLAVPGLIRGENGPVLFAPNVGWKDVDPVLPLQSVLGCPVFLLHDAACAAVAESHFGLGRELASFLFLTLGTAIGGAFIWQGRLFSQHGPFGSELGHIPLRGEGIPCSCGLPGCFQQYGSATALARQAQQAARQAGADSALWALCQGQPSQLTAPKENVSIHAGQLHFGAFGNRRLFCRLCDLHRHYLEGEGVRFPKMDVEHAIRSLNFPLLEALAPAVGKLTLEVLL